MDSPTISVVIPTWNRANTLGRALQSVVRQTLPAAEIIVVDDGSTDSTQELLGSLSGIHARLVVLTRNRGGANAARNAGIAAATGDLVAFLDSDDEWEGSKLKQQVGALMAQRQAVASFTGLRHDGASGRVFLPPTNPSLAMLRAANVLSTTSTAMVWRDQLAAVGGFDPSLPSCQDWDLWFRLRQRGPFAVVREPLVAFHADAGMRISTDFEKVMRGHVIIFDKLKSGIEDNQQAMRSVRAGHQLVLAEVYQRYGRNREAAASALSSLVTKPTKWGVRLAAESFLSLLGGRRAARE